jgi:hypothetical protein
VKTADLCRQHGIIESGRRASTKAGARLRHRVVEQEISEHRAAERPADERWVEPMPAPLSQKSAKDSGHCLG